MMEVIIVTNGQPIRRVAIYNRGPVGESFDPGDYAGGPGLRRYEWELISDSHIHGTRGHLLHRRDDGAEQLCAQVLEAVADRSKLTRTMSQADTWHTDDPEG